jgi:hypothetical protein
VTASFGTVLVSTEMLTVIQCSVQAEAITAVPQRRLSHLHHVGGHFLWHNRLIVAGQYITPSTKCVWPQQTILPTLLSERCHANCYQNTQVYTAKEFDSSQAHTLTAPIWPLPH